MTSPQPRHDLFADSGRPLLQLVQHLTGMETSFVTSIDWESQTQDIVLSLNTGSITVREGDRVDWSDSMCRAMFLAGQPHSADLACDIAGSETGRALGMRSFVVVPILAGDATIGTVCGSSAFPIALTDHQVTALELVAASLSQQLETRMQLAAALARAEAAARDAEQARRETREHRELAVALEVLANTDALTGLLNRRSFTARWEEQLARSGRRGYSVGVLLIDVDRFKGVNDGLGHAAGDAVLIALAQSLQAVSTSADLAARLGGDEFALVLTHTSADALLQVGAAVRQHFAGLMRDAGTPGITLSIGIAVSATCARRDLLAAADRALYVGKARGGDCAQLADVPLDA